MKFTIFYSWQSDAPEHLNRHFIRECLDDAAREISADVQPSPRVDSGMEGISGSPEVASIMFQKIDQCAVFVGDMTLVGEIKPQEVGRSPKLLPNPNVLLEMGYAAARIGWHRVICVMNEQFGKRDQLPFDVRNRRFPIDYEFGPADADKKVKKKKQLAKWLRYAIESVITNEMETTSALVSRMDIHCNTVAATFGKQDFFSGPDPRVTTLGGALDTGKFNAAITRLLDLGLIRADYDPSNLLYAYHWTYMGLQALIRLGIRPAPEPPAPSPRMVSRSSATESARLTVVQMTSSMRTGIHSARVITR